MDLTFQLIEQITKSFSDDQNIGCGAYGEVYKGVHNGEEIAIKKLYNMQGIDDKEFTNEFRNLMKVKHPNIVRLIGYCYEIRHRHVEMNGELVFAKIIDRLLCFEYMEGGSLAKYISDESCGLDWPTRYKIIKGICEGLNHLHNGRSDYIYHLDLKPHNILLDKNMMPRIADFGMSRLLASSKTHITQTLKGTLGYMPPEFIDKRRITKKYDVFSVGVIILQVMAGAQGYNNCCEMSSPQQFIELVHENWKKRLQGMPMQENTYSIDILAVQRCIELAVRCVEADPVKRPSIMDVVDELNKLDADMKNISLPCQETSDSKDLELDPALELRFPFELNRDISCCMQLINKTNEFVAFNIRTNKMKYSARPNNGTMAPYSKIYITFTLLAQDKDPPYMRCQDMLIVQSTRLSMESGDEITDEFFEKAVASRVVDEVKLPIVYVV
ncbi:cysteine-rich receptor-like protein kinase 44 [Triticum urartu]|uniref:Protein kinase domain-containing protein n=1 Tax=Triticum urartu TaxID=4572 RepID=A0A8R7UAL1_TRIUA|nr:cysteine-rich receptor-like protein kinase 44 [Triticum urartu]XP_048527341.1 cysteine-rich receptor-like protein kinase 44 [Triticum urartu]XP_048527342.1 cysteine-rich receptor-like protein kinase 44 [Triticum urartu]XP_048527343.1 cysteine-rich receptor-like protein kinase 44 [Triticum urartu]